MDDQSPPSINAIGIYKFSLPGVSPRKIHGWLIPELLALTLAANGDLLAGMRAAVAVKLGELDYEKGDEASLQPLLPNKAADRWLNYWATKGAERRYFADSALHRLARYREITKVPNVEHISLRAWPIHYRTPQAGVSGRSRLLLAAYDLRRHWLMVSLHKLRYPYRNQTANELTISSVLLSDSQWQAIQVSLIAQSSLASGDPAPTIHLHLPEESRLASAFQGSSLTICCDMPPSPSEPGRFALQMFRRQSRSFFERVYHLPIVTNTGRMVWPCHARAIAAFR